MAFEQHLAKLKDLSELMMEMAYSALFLHDKELAAQVHNLYQEFKKTYDPLSKVVQTAHINEHDKSYLTRLLVYIKEAATNAVFIADLSELERVPKVVTKAFSQTDTRIIQEVIHYSSFFAGKTVGELKVRTYTKARILAVQRNGKWEFNIDKNFKLKAKDVVVAVGTGKSEKILKAAINKSTLGF